MECPKCKMKAYESEKVCAFCGEILKREEVVSKPKEKVISEKEYKTFNLLHNIFALSLIIFIAFYMVEYSVLKLIILVIIFLGISFTKWVESFI